MRKILFAWVGTTDINASKLLHDVGQGPIASAFDKYTFTDVVLLSNQDKVDIEAYIQWLMTKTDAQIHNYHFDLTRPTEYGEIYESALKTIEDINKKLKGEPAEFIYHLSPGTPAMASVWILIGKTIYQATLIESSKDWGVREVNIPFDISADYLSTRQSKDEFIAWLINSPIPDTAEFKNIIHQCKEMKILIAQAKRLALFDVSVLIQGESGTGKELFARAIHTSSQRKDKPFVAVNCGAIPSELIESEFFGHKKGAFTGAVSDREGYFKVANGGTLFLDEIGELPLNAQVKLLRAIQDKKITKVGSTESEDVDVRIIAATNRNLPEEVSKGNFREDLFHRLAVGVLILPPIRDRKGDLNLLIQHVIDDINKRFANVEGWRHKKISVGARNLIHQHKWYGNMRELYNTISRAAIMTTDETIEADHIRAMIFATQGQSKDKETILNRPIGGDFVLNEVIKEVAEHYLKRAIKESKGNKTKMTELLGFSNYQTVSNWLKRYGIEK